MLFCAIAYLLTGLLIVQVIIDIFQFVTKNVLVMGYENFLQKKVASIIIFFRSQYSVRMSVTYKLFTKQIEKRWGEKIFCKKMGVHFYSSIFGIFEVSQGPSSHGGIRNYFVKPKFHVISLHSWEGCVTIFM